VVKVCIEWGMMVVVVVGAVGGGRREGKLVFAGAGSLQSSVY